VVKEVLYKLMPHPLKPKLLPIEQHLLPDLPTIVGNVDYQTLRAQLVRIHQLLVDGGIERDFIARGVSARRQLAVKRYQKSAKYERLMQEHSARALRCNLARVLLKEDFRGFSTRLADSPLLQRFVGIARIDQVIVPSKSSLQRYEQWLPESEVRAVIQRMLQLATQEENDLAAQPLDLAEPLNLDVYFLDMTCVKANIHWPADWVLLKDAVQTLMAAVELIRREGLRHRMDEPKTFLTRINRLCIEMTQGRRTSGGAKKRKRVLRAMKRVVKIVRGHAVRHRDLLEHEWRKTDWTRKQAEQILNRIDAVLTQLPVAVKQAHERIIGERPVKSADKILSFYEPQAHVIVRGKAGAEVEFGNTLVLGEADDGVIIDWHLIREQAEADCHQVGPSLARVQEAFGPRIRGIVTDRGCDSKDNGESLAFVGIKNGICPKNPREMKRRFQEPEFAAWQKRRAQTESRIAIFKREFLGQPLRSKGFAHRELMVTWAVFVHDLWMLARRPRASHAQAEAA
jgi:IS5 family transposase